MDDSQEVRLTHASAVEGCGHRHLELDCSLTQSVSLAYSV